MSDKMTDMEWLEYYGRNFHQIRNKGVTEDDGMWVANLALNGHYTVEIKDWTIEKIIKKGRKFEDTYLGGRL